MLRVVTVKLYIGKELLEINVKNNKMCAPNISNVPVQDVQNTHVCT